MAHLLKIGEAECSGALPLRLRHGLDRTTPDLAKVGAGVAGQGHRDRKKGILAEPEERQAEEHEEQQHEQGRGLEQLDVACGKPANRRHGRDAQQRNHQPDQPAADEGEDGEAERPAHRSQQVEELDTSEVANHACPRVWK
ncbi:hypothetical protein D3C85_1471330 [compost metagenome]